LTLGKGKARRHRGITVYPVQQGLAADRSSNPERGMKATDAGSCL